MAHPDDAELWTGATLAAHAAAGTSVTIAVAAHDPVRDAEAAAGAAVLGAQLVLLDRVELCGSSWSTTSLRWPSPIWLTMSTPTIGTPPRRSWRVSPQAVIATGRPRRVNSCDSYHHLDRHARAPRTFQ